MKKNMQILGTSHYSLNTIRRGQVLLIAVMLLATVITVVMTIAFNTTTETQVARLEADSQKALAAAEAGIDAVIKQSVGSVPINIAELGQFGDQKISGTAQVIGVTTPYFVTPLLQKDEQYTLYLSDYPNLSAYWSGALSLSLVSESGQCPAMEVTIITSTNSLERYAYNTCNPIISGAEAANNPSTPIQIGNTSFLWEIPSPLTISDGKILLVKIINGRTKVGFQSDSNLPAQGKTIESEARTESGVIKKVQLFQSYPQIPSSFFMTSF